MKASDLRFKINFQSATTASNSMGGRTASAWVTDKTLWAQIEHIGSSFGVGSDLEYEHGQTVGNKQFLITCRYQPDYEITKKTRVLWGTRQLTPITPINTDNIKKWMSFEANERI